MPLGTNYLLIIGSVWISLSLHFRVANSSNNFYCASLILRSLSCSSIMCLNLLPPCLPRSAMITPDLISSKSKDFPDFFILCNFFALNYASMNRLWEILTAIGSLLSWYVSTISGSRTSFKVTAGIEIKLGAVSSTLLMFSSWILSYSFDFGVSPVFVCVMLLTV